MIVFHQLQIVLESDLSLYYVNIYFLFLVRLMYLLHGPLMLPDKAKFVECSILRLALSFWMKHLAIGQLQKTATFSDFHWSPS